LAALCFWSFFLLHGKTKVSHCCAGRPVFGCYVRFVLVGLCKRINVYKRNVQSILNIFMKKVNIKSLLKKNSPVEKEYLEAIKNLEKTAKENS
jgi:hypothetical protein